MVSVFEIIGFVFNYGPINLLKTIFSTKVDATEISNALMTKDSLHIPYLYKGNEYTAIICLKNTTKKVVIVRAYTKKEANEENYTDLINSIAGPFGDFHNHTITPKMIGINEDLYIQTINSGFKTYKFGPNDDILFNSE